MTEKPWNKRPLALFGRLQPETRDHILTGVAAVLLTHLFIIAPLELRSADHFWPIGLLLMVLLGVGLLALARGVIPLALIGLFGLLLIVGFYFEYSDASDTLNLGARAAAWLLISLIIIWIVARAVYAPGPITYRRIIGAVLLYVNIGILFVALYVMLAVMIPDAFRGVSVRPHASLPSDFVYFSFVTLTTVGYGDIVPVDPLVRSLSNLEAVIGQLYPATVLARLVSDQVSTRDRNNPRDPS